MSNSTVIQDCANAAIPMNVMHSTSVPWTKMETIIDVILRIYWDYFVLLFAERIALNRRCIACPMIDVIGNEDFHYESQAGDILRGAFDWELYYKRIPINAAERKRRTHDSDPLRWVGVYLDSWGKYKDLFGQVCAAGKMKLTGPFTKFWTKIGPNCIVTSFPQLFANFEDIFCDILDILENCQVRRYVAHSYTNI